MRKLVIGVIALSCIGIAGKFAPAAAEEVKLKAASFLPARVIFAKYFYDWVKEVNKRCAGKVRISIVGPEAIGSLEQWSALRTGVVDMHYGPATYMSGVLPAGDVLVLAENTAAEQRRNGAYALFDEYYRKRMNAVFLTHILDGVKMFVYTNKPAKDGRFNGLRLRSVPIFDNFLKGLGAHTVRMPPPELFTALERGVVDGYGWPLWGITDFGWQKFTKYRYGPGFYDAATPIIVNLDRWNELDDAQRKCLQDMALWLEAQWPKWRAGETERRIELQKKAGIKYVDLGPEFTKRAHEIYWAALEKADPEFVRKIKPLLTR